MHLARNPINPLCSNLSTSYPSTFFRVSGFAFHRLPHCCGLAIRRRPFVLSDCRQDQASASVRTFAEHHPRSSVRSVLSQRRFKAPSPAGRQTDTTNASLSNKPPGLKKALVPPCFLGTFSQAFSYLSSMSSEASVRPSQSSTRISHEP